MSETTVGGMMSAVWRPPTTTVGMIGMIGMIAARAGTENRAGKIWVLETGNVRSKGELLSLKVIDLKHVTVQMW